MGDEALYKSYAENDDIKLLSLYKNGDKTAIAVLLLRYASLINRRISSYRINGVDNDDLKQEAYMALMNAVHSFDKEKNNCFIAYANLCISNRLKNVFVSAQAKKSKLSSEAVSIDKFEGFDIPDKVNINPEALVIQNESYDNLISLIGESLSVLEKDVLFSYLEGLDYEEIARKLNSSTKTVDNALQRARKKLKAVLNYI